MLKFPMVLWAFQRYFSSKGILVNFKALWRYFDHFKGFRGVLVILEFPCVILLILGIYRVFWSFWEILYVCCSFLKGILVILEALGMHIVKWMKVENITFIFFWQKIIYAHHNCIFLVNRRYF